MNVLTISALLCLSLLTAYHEVGGSYIKYSEFSERAQKYPLSDKLRVINLKDMKGTFNLTDVTSELLDDFMVNSLEKYIEPLHVLKIGLMWPKVILHGKYGLDVNIVNGTGTAKVTGSGNGELHFFDLFLLMTVHASFPNIMPHIPRSGFNINELSCSSAKVVLPNIQPNGTAGDNVVKYISEKLPELIKTYETRILRTVSDKIRVIINKRLAERLPGGIFENAKDNAEEDSDFRSQGLRSKAFGMSESPPFYYERSSLIRSETLVPIVNMLTDGVVEVLNKINDQFLGDTEPPLRANSGNVFPVRNEGPYRSFAGFDGSSNRFVYDDGLSRSQMENLPPGFLPVGLRGMRPKFFRKDQDFQWFP